MEGMGIGNWSVKVLEWEKGAAVGIAEALSH